MKYGYSHLRCGLLGEKLGHSFSPQIHAHLADYSYDLIERAPNAVEDFVKEGGYDAFNVTIPYKKAVMPFLDEISDEARRIGAVNTVVRRPNGHLIGFNTDYFGFRYMLDISGICVRDAKVLVLGSGGASVTAQAVLRDAGARQVLVVSRTGELTYEDLPAHADTDVIVNATPVGMFPKNGESPTDLSLFPNCRGVLDMIYNPSKTALLMDAESRGIPHANGLSMLVAQAVKAFEYFTSDPADFQIVSTIASEIERQTKNIVLIGMPGCGKSTVGKAMAEMTCRPFFDADEEFTRIHGVTPASVIESRGEDVFRQMEHAVLTELGKKSGSVISCGGGAVTREVNYAPLHQNGVILYLRRDLSLLATGGRPLSQRTSPEVLYNARKAAYERFADHSVDSTEIIEKTAEAMLIAFEACIKGEAQ